MQAFNPSIYTYMDGLPLPCLSMTVMLNGMLVFLLAILIEIVSNDPTTNFNGMVYVTSPDSCIDMLSETEKLIPVDSVD